MKKFLRMVLFIPVIFGCTGKTKVESEEKPPVTTPEITGEKMKITGLIESETEDGIERVVIVEKWKTRSRVTYETDEAFREELSGHTGEIVELIGRVGYSGRWSGEIEVMEIVGYESND